MYKRGEKHEDGEHLKRHWIEKEEMSALYKMQSQGKGNAQEQTLRSVNEKNVIRVNNTTMYC